MPIKSYLAFPRKGKKKELHAALEQLSGCEVVQAENKDVLVLVSDTANQEEEDRLLQRLQMLESLDHLNLIAGFNDDK